MRSRRNLGYIFPLTLILFLWTSCSDDQLFHGNARIQTTFRLKSPTALGGSVTIQDAYLKLNSIGISGTLGDQSVPPASYPVSPEEPPYRLTQSDTAQVTLTLPSRAYDLLDLHLLLVESQYQLITFQQPVEVVPPNNGGTTDAGGTPSGGDSGGSDDSPADNGDGGQQGDDGAGSGSDDDSANDSPDDDGANSGDDTNTPPQGDDNNDQGGNGNNDKNDAQKGEGNGDDKKDDGKKDNDGKGKDKDDKDDDDQDNDDKDDDDEDDDDEKDDGRARSEVDGTVDLDHFFQNAKPSLVVFATWNVSGENINIVFAVTDAERITIRATQNGNQRVILADHGTASVTFDPEDWFQSVSATDLQNASRQTYQGQSVVFIHHDHNTALFDRLYSSLVESTTFEFSVPSVE